jgi:hypothetical protein
MRHIFHPISARLVETGSQGLPLQLQVQAAAVRSLKLLDQPSDPEAAFTELFLTRRSPALMYDAFWRVSVPVDPKASEQAPDQLSQR